MNSKYFLLDWVLTEYLDVIFLLAVAFERTS